MFNNNYDEKDLLNLLQEGMSIRKIIKILSSENVTPAVLLKAIDIAKSYNNNDKVRILNVVCDSKKCNKDVTLSIIKNTIDTQLIVKAATRIAGDEEAIRCALVQSERLKLMVNGVRIEHILVNYTFEKRNLCLIVKNCNNTNDIVNAILRSNYDKNVVTELFFSSLSIDKKQEIINAICSRIQDIETLRAIVAVSPTVLPICDVLKSNKCNKEIIDDARYRMMLFDDMADKITLATAIREAEKRLGLINLDDNDISKEQIKENEIKEEIEEEPILFTVENEDSVTERLRMNVEDGMSTMLWGKSGIGKTQRVAKIDPTYTEIRLKPGMLPEEVVGGKEPNGEVGKLYPPQWYVTLVKKCTEEPDRMHILFIDELTNVRDNIKSLVWDIIEARRVNGNEEWVLPDNCAIVAAGNRPEESTAVVTDYNGSVLPEPLHRRFDFHIEIEFDIKEWQNWALEVNEKTGNLNIHPIVLSFCIANEDKVMFSSLNTEKITEPIHDPRRWEKLSKAIYMAEKRGGVYNHVSNKRIEECIGSELAPAFISYYEREPLDINKIINDEYQADDFKNIDDKMYALSMLISTKELSDVVIEDFIDKCLGDEYISIYHAIKKRNNKTLEIDNSKSVKM